MTRMFPYWEHVVLKCQYKSCVQTSNKNTKITKKNEHCASFPGLNWEQYLKIQVNLLSLVVSLMSLIHLVRQQTPSIPERMFTN